MEKIKIEKGKFKKITDKIGMSMKQTIHESFESYSIITYLLREFEKNNDFSFYNDTKMSEKVKNNLIDLIGVILKKVKIIPQPSFLVEYRNNYITEQELDGKIVCINELISKTRGFEHI